MPDSKIDITVNILTYNAEPYIGAILEALKTQKINNSYEVFIIDSGSKDKTLEIIRKYENIRLHQIDNSEYGHGKTRNLVAKMAKGDIVVYLSHDAIPSHDNWLYEMVKPFELNSNIVGVMGKQIPRQHCIPMLKYEIEGVFRNFGPDFGTTIFYKDTFIQSKAVDDAVGFYSDSNSAARKSFLLGAVPYQNVDYAEDQLFGRDIINKGLYKAYAPRGSVVHSNDLKLKEYKKRMFDETFALRKIGVMTHGIGLKTAIRVVIRGVLGDTVRILRDRSFSMKKKAYWVLVNPLFHIEKWRGVYAAAKADLNDSASSKKYSLESSRKKSNT